MKKKMDAVLVDVESGRARWVMTDGSLEDMHRLVGCDCIDISRQSVGGVLVDIVVDDEGLLKDGAVPSVVTRYGELYGNALVFANDDTDIRGLEPDEVDAVMRCVRVALYSDGRFREVLMAD